MSTAGKLSRFDGNIFDVLEIVSEGTSEDNKSRYSFKESLSFIISPTLSSKNYEVVKHDLKAPIKKGTVAGKVNIYANETKVNEIEDNKSRYSFKESLSFIISPTLSSKNLANFKKSIAPINSTFSKYFRRK